MPTSAIAVDVSRLLTSLRFPRPSGVERLELGYASWCDDKGPGVVLTPLGPRMVSPRTRKRIADLARHHWQEDAQGDLDRELAPYIAFVGGRGAADLVPPRKLRLPVSLLPGLAAAAFRMPDKGLPQKGAYLHTSLFRLEWANYFDWLSRRPDIRAIFTVYDVLPLEYPAFFRPGEDALHAQRLANAARYGAALITSGETTAETIRKRLQAVGAPSPTIHVVDLPVDDLFAAPTETFPALAEHPYFVMCGTIEPRKNHRLILDIWARLAKRQGRKAPRLIIAGRRGWRNDDVFRALDDREACADLILEAPHISTHALAVLLQNSRGLLSPSFAEGYGLPVAEALACGTQALISDTPIYRELWSNEATLLSLEKPEAWESAILEAALVPPRQLNRPPARVMRWPHHVERVECLVAAS